MQAELLLRASNLGYTAGKRVILDDISFELRRGQITTIIGPNGAGKSTLTNIVNGLISNFEGEIERAPGLRIGYLPQKVYVNTLMPLSVSRLLRLIHDSSDQEIEHALAQTGVSYLRQRQVRSLSEGELKRVLLARTTLGQPDLIVLDEPTAGVDIELRRTMWDFLDQINAQGTTIILTTHYLEEAERMCRNVAIIDEGHIIQNSSMESLLKQLNSETFVLYLRDSLEQAPQLPSFNNVVRRDDHSIEVEVPDSLSINDMIRELEAKGIVVQRLRNKVNRLEELFVKMTTKTVSASVA